MRELCEPCLRPFSIVSPSSHPLPFPGGFLQASSSRDGWTVDRMSLVAFVPPTVLATATVPNGSAQRGEE